MTLNMRTFFTNPWLLPVLSGVFIGTSFIPFPPWAAVFCFIPLWIFWEQQNSLKNIILSGVLTAFVFTLIGFNWVTFLLHEFAHFPWVVAGLGMILFALLAHLFVPIAGALWFVGCKKGLYSGWQSVLVMGLLTALVL
ncbi:MAG: apolipoprotein N-acyltransferase, partial [Gammaproteobacteria bacterium]